MSRKGISMRKTREIIRLHHEFGFSYRAIAGSCNVSPTTVGSTLDKAAAAGLSWPLPEISDSELQQRLKGDKQPSLSKPTPDWEEVCRELKRKGVTRQLLWEEYRQVYPDGYRYTQFCKHLKEYMQCKDPRCRMEHIAGEKVFVDWAGQTIGYAMQGEQRKAYLFVAVLGASNYTFAAPYRDMKMENWLKAHVEAFNYFNGVAKMIVPDNCKTAVSKACFYDPDLNPSYQALAEHYKIAVLPSRVRAPRDKAKVENGVRFSENRILAKLRNCQFRSFRGLQKGTQEALQELNERPFNKMDGCRRESFIDIEKDALQALPPHEYIIGKWGTAKVYDDYHIQVDKHYYSVPFQLMDQRVDTRLTDSQLEVFHDNVRVAVHMRSFDSGRATTLEVHRPPQHLRACVSETSENLIARAARVGSACAVAVQEVLDKYPYPEMGFRSCQGLLRFQKTYGRERLEQACARAVELGVCSYRSIANMLKNNRETQPRQVATPQISHNNIRGRDYYTQKDKEPGQ
jgi:transposase